jgi:N-acetylneuraminic acid mutarotase
MVGVSDRLPDGSPASGTGALGVFNLLVNADEISAELIPLRQNSLTDTLEVVDITNFLAMAPCTDCAKIRSISIDADGNIVVSIGIKHPFPTGEPLKPISGQNRGDLHVFNVEGTVVSNGTGISFPELGKAIAGFTLVNADAFTPYLDTVLDEIYPTDASLHPYILHFDDYTIGNFDPSNPMGFDSVTDPPPSGNLVMAMGCDYDYRDYIFNIDGTCDFIYVVGCTFAVSSASRSGRFTPEYRIPQHLKKAASEVSVEIITNNLAEGDISSTAEIEIHVVDISHGVDVGSNLNEMFADSSVGGITIEIPGIETSPVIVDISSPTGTGHDPSDPLVFAATITNTADCVEGTYTGIAKVLDSYSSGLNQSPLLYGMDGIKRVEPLELPLMGLFDITEFATYTVFEMPVETDNEPPVAILIPTPDPATIPLNVTVDFDATTSYDTDGTITLYEFDFDWDSDPANFAADESNATGLATSLPYTVMGTFTAGLRVTDNLGAVGYDSVEINVGCGVNLYNWDTSFPDMTTGRQYSAEVVVNDELWVIGGIGLTSIEVFNMTSETWDLTPRTPLPEPRHGHTAAYYDGKIYIMGGYSYFLLEYRYSQVVYDIATDTWDETHPDIPLPARNVAGAVVYQDEIYYCYGWNHAHGGRRADLDIYDPNTQTWRTGANAPYGRSSPVWTVVGDRIYGFSDNMPTSAGATHMEYYEPATDTWTQLGSTYERYLTRKGFVTIDNKIFVVGGNWPYENWTDSFDTTTETWAQLLDMPVNRGYVPGVAYYNCKLFVIGGTGDGDSNLTSVIAGEFN